MGFQNLFLGLYTAEPGSQRSRCPCHDQKALSNQEACRITSRDRGPPRSERLHRSRTASLWETSCANSESCHSSFRVPHHVPRLFYSQGAISAKSASLRHRAGLQSCICCNLNEETHAQESMHLSPNSKSHGIAADVELESHSDHQLKRIWRNVCFSFLLSTAKGHHSRRKL